MAVQLVKLLGAPVTLSLDGSINFTGEYNSGTAYSAGDSVSYDGSSYVAIGETSGNVPTNTTYWQILAEKGDPVTGYVEVAGDTMEGALVAADHGSAESPQVVNICYGTGEPPSAGSVPEGTIFFQYISGV